jgi:sporulation protein YtfJ
MESIKAMIDVNTIVGEAVETPDGTTIIPVSRVTWGYGAGGGDVPPPAKQGDKEAQNRQFGGGVGAGVSISPVAFLVIGQGQIKLLPIGASNGALDKLVDYIPFVFEKVNKFINKKKECDEYEE